MKQFLFILLLLLLATGCSDQNNATSKSSETTIINSLRGKFIRTSDNDRGGIERSVKLIKEIEFKDNYCHFTYATIKMSGKYEIDENYVYINTGSELGTLSLEIIDKDHLEGEGFIHGTFKRQGTFEQETSNYSTNSPLQPDPIETSIVETQPSTEKSGKRAPDEDNNEDNAPDPFSNPFAGQGSGDGSGFGSGDGVGSGSSGSSISSRVVVKDLRISDIKSEHDEQITLRLTIKADGTVASASLVRRTTTTTDMDLINQVMNAAKEQVRYNAVPGTPLMTKYYTVYVQKNEMPVYKY